MTGRAIHTSAAKLWAALAAAYCDRWVGHDCNGGIVDRIFCRLPSEPWWVRYADRWMED